MKLYRVIQPVNDIEIATQFYSTVTGKPGIRVSPGRHYFDLGGTILACYDPKADGDDERPEWKPHFNQYVYLSVTDLNAIRTRLVKLGFDSGNLPIEEMPWGERLLYTVDPSGNPICFVDEKTLFTG